MAARHAYVGHVDPAGVAGADAHFTFDGAGRESGPAPFQNKGRDAVHALIWRRFWQRPESGRRRRPA
jgi:hypothetical protein